MSSTVNQLLFDLSKSFSVGLVGHERRGSSRNSNGLADYVGQRNLPSPNDSTSKIGEGFGPPHDVEVLRNLWHFRIGRILPCGERLPVFGESLDDRVPSYVAGAEVTAGSLIVARYVKGSFKTKLALCAENESQSRNSSSCGSVGVWIRDASSGATEVVRDMF